MKTLFLKSKKKGTKEVVSKCCWWLILEFCVFVDIIINTIVLKIKKVA